MSALDRRNLQRELLSRMRPLRRFVEARIPGRFRGDIDTDDILQETWIAAYRTADAFQPQHADAVDRWLMRIAKSKIVDAIRLARTQRRGGDRRVSAPGRRRSSLADLFATVEGAQRTPSAEIRASEAAHLACIALQHLAPRARRLMEMRYLEGVPQKEIARRLEMTETAVNGQLHRGLRALRRRLGAAAKYFSDVRSVDEGRDAGTSS